MLEKGPKALGNKLVAHLMASSQDLAAPATRFSAISFGRSTSSFSMLFKTS